MRRLSTFGNLHSCCVHHYSWAQHLLTTMVCIDVMNLLPSLSRYCVLVHAWQWSPIESVHSCFFTRRQLIVIVSCRGEFLHATMFNALLSQHRLDRLAIAIICVKERPHELLDLTRISCTILLRMAMEWNASREARRRACQVRPDAGATTARRRARCRQRAATCVGDARTPLASSGTSGHGDRVIER